MAKHETSDSESEEMKGMTEYEKQRLSRIAENRARLEALGLPQMASKLKGSSSKPHSATKGKEKKKVEDDDDEDDGEYVPEEEREPSSCSSSEQDDDHKDQDFSIQNASGSQKRKMKNKVLKKKAIVSGKKNVSISEYIDYDDDEAMRQAIALSLQDSAEGSCLPDKNAVNISRIEKKEHNHVQEDKGRKKNKKSFASRLQLTEDELIVNFFQLDEAGKGTLSVRDIQRAATAHDFLWTDQELVDMIRCFDSDGEGKLSLDDFRRIVVRCNMIKES